MRHTVSKSWQFQAAHDNPHHPGSCRRLHGHTYTLRVWVEGPVQKEGPGRGMVADFGLLSKVVNEQIVDRLDHYYINDAIPELDATTVECIAEWAFKRLRIHFPNLVRLRLAEGATAYAEVSV